MKVWTVEDSPQANQTKICCYLPGRVLKSSLYQWKEKILSSALAMMKIRTKPIVHKAPEAEGRKTSLTHCPTPNSLLLLVRLVHSLAEKYDCKIKN